MAETFTLEVVTPERLFYEGPAELVVVKTLNGQEGFMARHSWACKLLASGELRIKEPGTGQVKKAALSGGFIDVQDNIIVFADAAEWPDEIDVERAERALERAESRLKTQPKDNIDIHRAKIAIDRAMNRLHVAGKR